MISYFKNQILEVMGKTGTFNPCPSLLSLISLCFLLRQVSSTASKRHHIAPRTRRKQDIQSQPFFLSISVRWFESWFLSGWTVGSWTGRMRHYEMAHVEPLDKVVERPDKAHRAFP
jgi:hypothetical protein